MKRLMEKLTAWTSIQCPICKASNSVRLRDMALNKRTICSGCHEFIHLAAWNASEHPSVDEAIKDDLQKFERMVGRNCKN